MTQEQVSHKITIKAISAVSKYLLYIALGGIAISGLMTGVDVVARYIFNSPVPGVYQLQEMLLIAMIALPMAFCQQKGKHIRVDIFLSMFKGKARPAFELLTVIIALVLFALATYITAVSAWQSLLAKDYAEGLIRYPLWPAKTLIPIGTGSLCLRLIVDTFIYGSQLFGKVSTAAQGGEVTSQ
ncbi:TRAP transporter small permease subunit [Chloroflexota bacterium]